MINEDIKSWNLGLWNELLQPHDVQNIIQILLISSNHEDRRMWHHNSSNKYSMNSGHSVAIQWTNELARHVCRLEGDWQKIWNLYMPLKFKNFVWLTVRGILPSTTNLRAKSINMDSSCPHCSYEDNLHLLALSVCSCVLEDLSVISLSSCLGLLQYYWNLSDVFAIENICAIMWSLWTRRNWLLWKGKTSNCNDVLESGIKVLEEWQAMRSALNNDTDIWARPSIVG